MLRIATDRAAPGMVLALPVLHPDKPGHVLLRPGAMLEHQTIRKLDELGIARLWVRYPPTDFLLRYTSAGLIAEHGVLTAKLGECFDAVTSGVHAQLDFHQYAGTVRSMVQRFLDDPHAAVFLSEVLDGKPGLLSHCTSVCVMSLLMGLKLDGYLVTERPRVNPRRAQSVENLGVGALLHDVGMLRLAPEVVDRWERTGDDADLEWRRHAKLGFETVRGKVPATAAAAVLHHHQRQDGSGFPRLVRFGAPPEAQRGSEIHIFARIIAVADVFDRVRRPPEARVRPGEPTTVPAVRALKRTLELTRAGKLDPVVFKALLAVVPAYAPGSRVTLSDGRTCVVTAWDPVHPCRPTVAPLPDAVAAGGGPDGGELGEPIDLRKHPELSVAVTDGEPVAADNFEARSNGEFDLRFQFAAGLLDSAAVPPVDTVAPDKPSEVPSTTGVVRAVRAAG